MVGRCWRIRCWGHFAWQWNVWLFPDTLINRTNVDYLNENWTLWWLGYTAINRTDVEEAEDTFCDLVQETVAYWCMHRCISYLRCRLLHQITYVLHRTPMLSVRNNTTSWIIAALSASSFFLHSSDDDCSFSLDAPAYLCLIASIASFKTSHTILPLAIWTIPTSIQRPIETYCTKTYWMEYWLTWSWRS